jgi:hypothetical protein
VELFLNLAGAFVAVVLVCLWLWCTPRTAATRASLRTQWIALALLILILFPLISVTDDLLAAQNPAESDSFQRRDSAISVLNAALASSAILSEAVHTEIPAVVRVAALSLEAAVPAVPALAPIENRPPPTA